ncbi:MAG: N-acetyltransferase [Anaerolineales bacterium]|nr:N-acetyltransferase [Anaerolineales bacterium]MBP6209885.1 N-acetyltransferase [Anaerolineales bacterium]MBP8164845.1 N-acetyltransferase [Anaerolineales bacterium]
MPQNEPLVIHVTERQSFQVQLESHTASLNYYLSGDTIVFTHTGVPSALEGRGIGSALVREGLKFARENNLKVKSLCWFVDKYMQRHPNE